MEFRVSEGELERSSAAVEPKYLNRGQTQPEDYNPFRYKKAFIEVISHRQKEGEKKVASLKATSVT
jgi:hypothetical protein